MEQDRDEDSKRQPILTGKRKKQKKHYTFFFLKKNK